MDSKLKILKQKQEELENKKQIIIEFEKKLWVDRDVQHPYRRKIKKVSNVDGDDIIDIERYEGDIKEIGDAFDSPTMNNLEDRITQLSLDIELELNNLQDQIDELSEQIEEGGGSGGGGGGGKIGKEFKDLSYEEQDEDDEEREKIYEDAIGIRYKPKGGETTKVEDFAIRKFSEHDKNKVTTGIFFTDEGSSLYNFQTLPARTRLFVENELDMGALVDFHDGTSLTIKPYYEGQSFIGFKYNNGYQHQITFNHGDFSEAEEHEASMVDRIPNEEFLVEDYYKDVEGDLIKAKEDYYKDREINNIDDL